jgi:hypothetical protein
MEFRLNRWLRHSLDWRPLFLFWLREFDCHRARYGPVELLFRGFTDSLNRAGLAFCGYRIIASEQGGSKG